MKRWFPQICWLGCVGWLLLSLPIPQPQSPFHVREFGSLPVVAGGRMKPMDTVARTSLMIIHGKQSLQLEGRPSLNATEWLMDVMMLPGRADAYAVFRIDHSDVLGLLGIQQTNHRKYFSYQELQPHLDEIGRQAQLAEKVKSENRSLFQRAILKLFHQADLYYQLKNSLRVDEDIDPLQELELLEQNLPAGLQAFRDRQAGKKFNERDLAVFTEFANRYQFLSKTAYMLVIPSTSSKGPSAQWLNMGQGLFQTFLTGKVDPTARLYFQLATAYRKLDSGSFNRSLETLRQQLRPSIESSSFKIDYEFRFNHFQPFYKSMTLYVLVFVFVLISWLSTSTTFNRASFLLLLLAFAIHTLGLLSRMYLQGRPPVTNLYSSAIFVGWGAVLLGLILEKIYRDGIGTLTSAAMGFLTLLIAHHLSGDGDTLEMLRAVLDTNYWLATHVVVITLGYASTFLAGFLAIVYTARQYFLRLPHGKMEESLERMVYGIVCFATLFSFVGTVLGGIWADQSWGRFWGWDPKENGALIMVLWNALILHARWGGLIRRRGLMAAAVFGNIVTSFSWFGVNMLGVGLHNYGFMEKAFFWLILFVISQVAIIAVVLLSPPKHMFRQGS